MSIFTLKRKSQATTNLSNQKSAFNLGFSLNNPRRVGAHSGEPQTQTPYRGTAARGNGGPINQGFNQSIITKSQYICVDDPSKSHKSVKSNQAMLSQRNKWLNRGYPYTVVKDCNTNYSDRLTRLKGNIAKQEKQTKNVNNGNCVCVKNTLNPTKTCNYQKDILKVNYDTYYNSKLLAKECIPLPHSQAHFPPQNKRGIISCNIEQSYEDFKIIQNNLQSLCS